ncbi:MAG: ABC transporter ATP-binding protein [Deltaproteobacteria bacterium]|nr:ABC transporter ATP-binding protein [Deltaproteobacteria bacterium]
MKALEVRGVRKRFGRVTAVERVDLAVDAGQFVGLIGHNGAGKSTLLRIITGLLRPTEGTVLVGGVDVATSPREARLRMGVVPEEPALYPYLSAREYLDFVAEVRGVGGVEEALELTGLGPDADRLVREYSQGMRRKTALAAALLGAPGLLLLDESLNGLDPPSAARVKGALRQRVDQGATVILSTHVVETVQAVADRVVMLAHGRVVADEAASALGGGGLERLFLERLAETM